MGESTFFAPHTISNPTTNPQQTAARKTPPEHLSNSNLYVYVGGIDGGGGGGDVFQWM